MASVKDTVFEMMTQYPSLFKNKTDCYAFLFFRNGNGYNWIDGELVSISPDHKGGPAFENEHDAVVEAKKETSHDYGDKYYNYIRLDVRRNNMMIHFAINNIDLIMDESIDFYTTQNKIYYDGTDYCLLMKIPDDAKDDWVEAAEEVIRNITPYITQKSNIDSIYSDEKLTELLKDASALKKRRFPKIIENEKYIKELLEKIRNKK